MRTMSRAANALAVTLYRWSNGRIGGTIRGVPVLLLTVPGRKTGRPHTVPVLNLEHDGGYLVAGSAGGAKIEPQWFRNLRAARRAHVQIGGQGFDVDVRVADDAEREALWRDVVLTRSPFFAKYQEKAGRAIPVAVLTATTL